MTDLEITKACAEAMGLGKEAVPTITQITVGLVGRDVYAYNPLHDDAQAMALVKRFNLWIRCDRGAWSVVDADDETKADNIDDMVSGWGNDLNRAICECVANLHNAKLKEKV